MRFLLDENLSPRLAEPLQAAGHDVTHVHDVGLTSADDERVIATARSEQRSWLAPTPTSERSSPGRAQPIRRSF